MRLSKAESVLYRLNHDLFIGTLGLYFETVFSLIFLKKQQQTMTTFYVYEKKLK